MDETPWQVVGRFARDRRERLGLKQEELQLYGGPKVSTVGKFERAAQEGGFPLRTQHAMENALGWRRGAIEDLLREAAEPDFKTMWEEDSYVTLVEDNPPDLSHPMDPDKQVRRAGELTDEELLAELTYRMKKYAEGAPGAANLSGEGTLSVGAGSVGSLQRNIPIDTTSDDVDIVANLDQGKASNRVDLSRPQHIILSSVLYDLRSRLVHSDAATDLTPADEAALDLVDDSPELIAELMPAEDLVELRQLVAARRSAGRTPGQQRRHAMDRAGEEPQVSDDDLPTNS